MITSRRTASLVTLAGGRDGGRQARANLPLAALRRDPPWTGPGDGAVPVDEDVVSGLALWLADVAEEAALRVRPLEAGSSLSDTTPKRGPAPVVAG